MKKTQNNNKSFFAFIKDKSQWPDWILTLLCCIIGYIIIKMCYPFPATITDSGTYVHSAMNDMFSIFRPFGYSYFLQVTHALSSNIHSIFIVQMLIYFLSVIFFAFTIKYFFAPTNKVVWYILLFFFVFNPIAFYMANAILSDLLFAMLVYLMLASSIFMFKRKSWIAFICFVIFLYCSLHVRYSAMVFPVLFAVFFLMVKGNVKWVYIAATVLVTFVFYNQTKSNVKKTTGLDQFSTGFDGWQIANNAIHIVPFIDLDPKNITNNDLRFLHQFIMQYNDVILKETKNGTYTNTYFMWTNDFPLKICLFEYMQTTRTPYPVAWAKLGSGLYKDYGQYIIKKYPGQFMLHYYLPTAKGVFYNTSTLTLDNYRPPTDIKEIISWYNIPESVDMSAKHLIYKNFVVKIIQISITIVWAIIAVLMILWFIKRKQLSFDSDSKKILWGIFIFGFIYYASTVFASPIEIRYWLPMGAVQFSFIYILANRLVGLKKKEVS